MASGTINGSTNNQYMQSRITWSASTNVAGNYSDVTAHLQYRRTNGYTTHGTWSGKLNINGSEGGYSKSVSIGSSWVEVASRTVRVNHNGNGTKRCWIGASGGISGTSFTSTSCGATVTLDTIPRASGISLSAASVDYGTSFTVTISPHSGSFTHEVNIQGCGDIIWYRGIAAGTTSVTVTIPKDRVTQNTTGTATTARVYLDTYSGSTKIGTTKATITATVPADIVPTTGTIAITDSKNAGANLYGNANTYAANFSALTVTIPAAAYHGDFADTATIKSITTSYGGKTYTGSPVTITPTAAGTSNLVVTVTDSRGRTATTTKAITVKAYKPPTIHVTASRYADAAGQTPDDTGAYAKVTITGTLDTAGVASNRGAVTLSWQDVDQAEVVQIKTYTVTDAAWTLSQMIAASDTKAYTITAAITDRGSTRQAAMALSNGVVPVDFLAGGKGVCFGATATKPGFGIEMAPLYGQALLDYVHPVGSYYLSDQPTSPAQLFGGTWEKVTDGALISAGMTYWRYLGEENEKFTLTQESQVRYGSNSKFVTLTMNAGTYTISNAGLGVSDPSPSILKGAWVLTKTAVGQTYGENEHTITDHEMPVHGHEQNGTTLVWENKQIGNMAGSGKTAGGYDYMKELGANVKYVKNAGSGFPSNNMQKSRAINIWKRIA